MPVLYNVNFINPFLHAVIEVLSAMAQVEPRPGKPYINVLHAAKGDVTGLIGVTGYARGTISLTLSKDAILHIVSRMLMTEYTEINDDIIDATGELTNMIAGHAREALEAQGMLFQASSPSVVVGRGHRIDHISGAPVLAIPFSIDHGDFVVETAFTDSVADASLPEK